MATFNDGPNVDVVLCAGPRPIRMTCRQGGDMMAMEMNKAAAEDLARALLTIAHNSEFPNEGAPAVFMLMTKEI